MFAVETATSHFRGNHLAAVRQVGEGAIPRLDARPAVIKFVLQHADIDLEAGNGCRAYRISDKATVELLKNGIAISELDRARNVVLIVCEDSGEIVTAMHDCNQVGRRYRRQWPTWKGPSTRSSPAFI